MAVLWRWEMKFIDWPLTLSPDTEQLYDATAWPWNGILWCLLCVHCWMQTLTLSTVLQQSGDKEMVVTVKIRVTVMLYWCQDNFSTKYNVTAISWNSGLFLKDILQTLVITQTIWRAPCLRLQNARRTLLNLWKFKLQLNDCQTVPQANVCTHYE